LTAHSTGLNILSPRRGASAVTPRADRHVAVAPRSSATPAGTETNCPSCAATVVYRERT